MVRDALAWHQNLPGQETIAKITGNRMTATVGQA